MNLRCLQRPLAVRALRASGLAALSLLCASAWAAPTPQDAKGLWLSSDKGACSSCCGGSCSTVEEKPAGPWQKSVQYDLFQKVSGLTSELQKFVKSLGGGSD